MYPSCKYSSSGPHDFFHSIFWYSCSTSLLSPCCIEAADVVIKPSVFETKAGNILPCLSFPHDSEMMKKPAKGIVSCYWRMRVALAITSSNPPSTNLLTILISALLKLIACVGAKGPDMAHPMSAAAAFILHFSLPSSGFLHDALPVTRCLILVSFVSNLNLLLATGTHHDPST
ncbi:hypothetical protein K435DRAFT_806372 [Dendrothele bispora CBS 962.96]|uniref:Uncharacterized protein n=1 Tax=Dendrothele bispora (strain CBS 962.96) TaxID=1314807 RepID=A0A4S8L817_DENBC|nr:hypothetical protein K435DRAFT_806372 [Dendrothele bispora CBS 962.96]